MGISRFILIHFVANYVWYMTLTGFIGEVDAGDLEVQSLNYNGTWTEFCDRSNIAADFADFADHDVMRLRILLCEVKERNGINRQSLSAFSAYKYCLSIRSTTEGFYKALKDRVNGHSSSKSGEMPTSKSSVRPTDECYTKCMGTFTRECMGKHNPCLRMFQSLISSACVKPGIKPQDISRYIVEVCDGKFISEDINWEPFFMSLRYTDD